MTNYHNPILLQESIDGLNIQGDGIYVDLTFGGGGHSNEILNKLSAKGRLIAFDTDKDAILNIPNDQRLMLIKSNFRYFLNHLEYHNLVPVNGILADLGLSSHHIDIPERGFSYRFDAPLDMRMNQDSRKTAADVLNQYSTNSLANIFWNFGEFSKGISEKFAKSIEYQRHKKTIKSTFDLKNIVSESLGGTISNQTLSKLFQALRIEVNQELDALKNMLESLPDVLKEGGRVVIITYHSLEDRLVKYYFKNGTFDQKKIDKSSSLKPVNKKVIIPNYKEIKKNKRARSAKLRIAEKI